MILIKDKIRLSLAAVCPSGPCKNCAYLNKARASLPTRSTRSTQTKLLSLTYMKNVHRDFFSVEPRCNRGPRDWQFVFFFAIQCNPYITKLYMTTPSVERTILFSTRNSKLYMKRTVGICHTAHVHSSFLL